MYQMSKYVIKRHGFKSQNSRVVTRCTALCMKDIRTSPKRTRLQIYPKSTDHISIQQWMGHRGDLSVFCVLEDTVVLAASVTWLVLLAPWCRVLEKLTVWRTINCNLCILFLLGW